MPGDSKTLKLREMFRLRSSQRHRELRLQHSESSDQTIKTERTAVVNTAPAIAPQPVPIVRVQCDPSFEDEGEYERELYRVRSFKRTSKGLISLGDSFRSRSTTNCSRGFDIPRTSAIAAKISLCRGKKNSECYSEISGRKERHSTACDESPSTNVVGEHIFVNCPTASHRPSSTNSLTNIAAPVKVQILGGPTVGKTMLCRQFLTAEFMGDKTESFSEDCIERFVVIEVDGWNRSLMLIDNIREEAADEKHSLENSIAFFTPRPSLLNDEPTLRLRSASIYATKDDVTNSEITDPETLQRTQRKSSICNFKPETLVERRTFPELEMRILDVDIYLVVYAVDEESTFKLAKSIFKKLQDIKLQHNKLRLFYLVGNKMDLVRRRQVTTQRGRKFAAVNGAIFFEVSAAINHLVDELLVDMVVQWRKEAAQFEFSRLGLPVHNLSGTGDSSDTGGPSDSRGRQSWTSTLSNPRNMLQRIFKQQFTTKSCIDLQKH